MHSGTHMHTCTFWCRVVVFLWQALCVQRTAEMWMYDVAGIGKGGDCENDSLMPSSIL